jgi:hypothetical protein
MSLIERDGGALGPPNRSLRKPAVYIAGPIDGSGRYVEFLRTALTVAEDLRLAGIVPYVPSLSFLWELVQPHHDNAWTAMNYEWLQRCDALVRIPGTSARAEQEWALARLCGIPHFLVHEVVRINRSSPWDYADPRGKSVNAFGPSGIGVRRRVAIDLGGQP